MKVIIPDVKPDGTRYEFKPLNVIFKKYFLKTKIYKFFFQEKDGILLNWKNGRREGIRFLFNKPPKWNE